MELRHYLEATTEKRLLGPIKGGSRSKLLRRVSFSGRATAVNLPGRAVVWASRSKRRPQQSGASRDSQAHPHERIGRFRGDPKYQLASTRSRTLGRLEIRRMRARLQDRPMDEADEDSA